MNDKILNVAVIGCGTIANLQHLPNITANKTVKIKYAVDIIIERARAASEKFGIENYCEDYHDALRDPSVDAVIICTPNFSHYTITVDSLRAGKHVFCEKPVTVNYDLSVKMAMEEKKSGKFLDIGVCNRFNKNVELIKEYIEQGKLGNVYHTYISFRAYRSIPGLGGDFTTKSVAGGGVLIDWGIHFIDLTLYALGLPNVKTVSSVDYNMLGKNINDYVFTNMWAGPPKPEGVCDVDDFVSGFIRTDKATISYNGAWAQNVGMHEMYIDFLGDKAGIRMDYEGKFTMWSTENGILEKTVPDFTSRAMHDRETIAFFDSIRSGVRTRNCIANVLESMKVLDAIYESGRQGKEITL